MSINCAWERFDTTLRRMAVSDHPLRAVAAVAWLFAAPLASCSTVNPIWAALSGEEAPQDREGSRVYAIAPEEVGGRAEAKAPSATPPAKPTKPDTAAEAAPTPKLGRPAATTAKAPSSTIVGQEVQRLRAELAQTQSGTAKRDSDFEQIRQSLGQDAAAYYRTIGVISARLQMGTTPGNPEILAQWNDAHAELGRVERTGVRLVNLSAQAANDASFAAYLAASANLLRKVSGGIDEDRREISELEVDATAVEAAIQQQITRIASQIQRQNAALSAEHSNVARLASAIREGNLYASTEDTKGARFATRRPPASELSGASSIPQPMAVPSRPLTTGSGPAHQPPRPLRDTDAVSLLDLPGRLKDARPFVVIRFDQPDINYEEPVRNAIGLALQRKANAVFDVLALAPDPRMPGEDQKAVETTTEEAKRVIRSLMDTGVTVDHLTLTMVHRKEARTPEVRIFVR